MASMVHRRTWMKGGERLQCSGRGGRLGRVRGVRNGSRSCVKMCVMQRKWTEVEEGGGVKEQGEDVEHTGRRSSVRGGVLAMGMLVLKPIVDVRKSMAEPAPPPPPPLCDETCVAALGEKDEVMSSSGLRYRDVVVGKGPAPIQGFQVVVNYTGFVASTGQQFTTTVGKAPVDVRAGTGGLIAGLEEGLLTMRAGGIRRLYIPGSLAYPRGLPSSPGQPRVPPLSDVIFDLQLLYIPGLDDEEEEEDTSSSGTDVVPASASLSEEEDQLPALEAPAPASADE